MGMHKEYVSDIIAELGKKTSLDREGIERFEKRLTSALKRLQDSVRQNIERNKKALDDAREAIKKATANAALASAPVVTSVVTSDVTSDVTNQEKEGKERTSPQTPLREKGPEKEHALTLAGECSPRASAPAPARTCVSTRTDVPSLDTILALCDDMGVLKDYARWWHNEMRIRDWMTSGGKRIDNSNWRAILRGWYTKAGVEEIAHARDFVRKRGEAKRLLAILPKDWILCEERCGRFKAGACSAGIKIPPEKLVYPMPPEECPRFKALPPVQEELV